MEKSKRIAKWDNVKFILITCVVIGHMIDPYRKGSANVRSLYWFIYSFHMPAFIFVSGLFAKNVIKNKRYDKMFSFLIMYIVIKFALFITECLAYGKVKELSLFTSADVSWYALAMFMYYLATAFLRRYRTLYVITAAVVFGCISGYAVDIGNFLVLSRAFAFFPFFLAGYYLESEKILAWTNRKVVKVGAAVILVVLAVVSFRYIDKVYWTINIFKGKYTYDKLEMFSQWGGVLRFLYYAAVILLITAVIAIVPNLRGFWTTIGSRTLQIYVFHYCLKIVFFKTFSGKQLLQSIWPEHASVLVVMVSIGIVLLLSIKPLAIVLQKIIYPAERAERDM